MAFVRKSLTRETTTTTGTGAVALGGARVPGRTFSSVMANGDTTEYSITHQTLNEWEIGLGTFNTGNTLTRTSVIESSNANAAVNFSAGTKNVDMIVSSTEYNTFDAAATTSVQGQVELATDAETNTGTDTVRAMTPSNLGQWPGKSTLVTLGTVTTGNVDAVVSAASDTVAGKIEIAIETEMETGTDVVRAVTPGRQQFHDSAAKCWGICANSTTILASYNITSYTDTGVGDGTWNINVDFESTNWVPVCTQRHTVPSTTVSGHTINGAKAAGTLDIDTFDIEKAVGTAAPRLDSNEVGFVGFGRRLTL